MAEPAGPTECFPDRSGVVYWQAWPSIGSARYWLAYGDLGGHFPTWGLCTLELGAVVSSQAWHRPRDVTRAALEGWLDSLALDVGAAPDMAARAVVEHPSLFAEHP